MRSDLWLCMWAYIKTMVKFGSCWCTRAKKHHQNKNSIMAKEWIENTRYLFIWNLYLSRVDTVNDIVGWLTVNCASNALCRSQNLLRTPSQGFSKRFRLHCPCDINNFVQGDVTRVFDILLLLAVSWGLCQQSTNVKGSWQERYIETHPSELWWPRRKQRGPRIQRLDDFGLLIERLPVNPSRR